MKKDENILVLGDGLLGSEIIKQTGWDYLSQDKDNIDAANNFIGLMKILDDIKPDVIVNCIGYTNTYDPEKKKHWDLNYKFVVNLADYCDNRDIDLVHISTDYIFANSTGGSAKEDDIPVHQETWYAYTKLLSDGYVQLIQNYLLIRCSFKPTPFPYEKAFNNVMGNFDYVDVIAGQIIDLIKEERKGIWNVGTDFKSIYDLAVKTKPEIGCWHSPKLPTIEMDLTKFKNRNEKKQVFAKI